MSFEIPSVVPLDFRILKERRSKRGMLHSCEEEAVSESWNFMYCLWSRFAIAKHTFLRKSGALLDIQSHRLNHAAPERVKVQGDELGRLLGIRGRFEFVERYLGRVDHGEFAIVHLNDVDAGTYHSGAESEA